jgi:hypothetical protein
VKKTKPKRTDEGLWVLLEMMASGRTNFDSLQKGSLPKNFSRKKMLLKKKRKKKLVIVQNFGKCLPILCSS